MAGQTNGLMTNGQNLVDKNPQMQQKMGNSRNSSGLFNQAFGPSVNNQMPNNMNNINNSNLNDGDNPLGAGLSSLTSTFSSGIANLKLTASNFQANKFTSKLMNPFSS